MTPLGAALTFWLRYPGEMGQLTDDPPNTADLVEPDRVLEMIRAVRERAEVEVLTLMGECSGIVESHFSTFLKPLKRRRESKVVKNWSSSTTFRMSGRKRSGLEVEVGVWLHDSPAVLIPWIWAAGRKHFEDRARRVLGDRLDSLPGQPSRSAGIPFELYPGTVGLRPVPVPLPNLGFDVDRSPLLDELRCCLTAITCDDITALLTDS